jgi:poly(3-hydroxybutyrate) depolymerase
MKLRSGPRRPRHFAFVASAITCLVPTLVAQKGQKALEAAAVRTGVFEVPMPAFSKILPAYYVMFVPESYDPARKWPLIVDLHGASNPERKGALYTVNEIWKNVGASRGYLVAAPQCRTRSWGYTGMYRGKFDCDHGGVGPNSDVQYALSVLSDVAKKYAVDQSRILLAGFSSGADFIYRSELAVSGRFAACLPICCGPPSMVRKLPAGLEKMQVYSVTGALDVRRDGPWEGFLKLRRMGGDALFREVPGLAHKFPALSEYGLFIDWFERLGKQLTPERLLALAAEAEARKDYLLAIHCLNQVTDGSASKERLSRLGAAAIQRAETRYEAGEYVVALDLMKKAERQFYGLPVGQRAAARRLALDKVPKLLGEVARQRKARQDARLRARLRTFLGVTLGAAELAGAQGARIETVRPGTVAAKSGLKSGDIVTSFDQKKISKQADLAGALSRKRPGQKAVVEISRDGKTSILELSFPPRSARRRPPTKPRKGQPPKEEKQKAPATVPIRKT